MNARAERRKNYWLLLKVWFVVGCQFVGWHLVQVIDSPYGFELLMMACAAASTAGALWLTQNALKDMADIDRIEWLEHKAKRAAVAAEEARVKAEQHKQDIRTMIEVTEKLYQAEKEDNSASDKVDQDR